MNQMWAPPWGQPMGPLAEEEVRESEDCPSMDENNGIAQKNQLHDTMLAEIRWRVAGASNGDTGNIHGRGTDDFAGQRNMNAAGPAEMVNPGPSSIQFGETHLEENIN